MKARKLLTIIRKFEIDDKINNVINIIMIIKKF